MHVEVLKDIPAVKYNFYLTPHTILYKHTCCEVVDAVFLKMKAPTLNFWTFFELAGRNFECSVNLPSIMQLQLDKMHMFTTIQQARTILILILFKYYP